MPSLHLRLVAALLAAAVLSPVSPVDAAPPDTTLISSRIDDFSHGGFTESVVIARNGGFVAFASSASNLVVGDTNALLDIFVTDVATGVTQRVSQTAAGEQPTFPSTDPAISDDGRFVSFLTQAALVVGDTNNAVDAYRFDRQTGEIVRASLNVGGAQFDGTLDQDLSGDGGVVAFVAVGSNGVPTAWARVLATARTEVISFPSFNVSSVSRVAISQDGDKVVAAVRNVGGGTQNHRVLRHDISSDAVDIMSPLGGLIRSLAVSDDGQAVAFARTAGVRYVLAPGSPELTASSSTSAGGIRFAGGSKNVLFHSSAAEVPGDSNNSSDVFLRTTAGTPTTIRLSVFFKLGQFPMQVSGSSLLPMMSADQQSLVFLTTSPSLAGASQPDPMNIVLQRNNSYTRITRAPAGSTAAGQSFDPVVTPDGRYVFFRSTASDLGPADFNSAANLYRFDRVTGERLDVTGHPNFGNIVNVPIGDFDVSDDGNRVALATTGHVLAAGVGVVDDGRSHVYLHDIAAGTTTLISQNVGGVLSDNGISSAPRISGDGRFVVFQSSSTDIVFGDTNGAVDVFLHDTSTDTTERVSLAFNDQQIVGSTTLTTTPDVSDGGRFITWTTNAVGVVPGTPNVAVRVMLRDRALGTTELVAEGNSGAMSADGNAVAFHSFADTLVAGDTNGLADVFVRDMTTGVVTRVSVTSAGAQAVGGDSFSSSLSTDGRFVVFVSAASNLVAGDTNGVSDVFRFDRQTGAVVRASVDAAGGQQNGPAVDTPAVSADGVVVVFASNASNLVAGDNNQTTDVVAREIG